MKRSMLSEPVVRKGVSLVALFLAAMALLVLASEWNMRHDAHCDGRLSNQHAKRLLGNVIQKHLQHIRVDLGWLAVETDPRRARVVHRRVAARIASVEDVLAVLSRGGTYDHAVPINLDNLDEFRERIPYQPDRGEGIVLEVIELVPKLADLELETQALVEAVEQRAESPPAGRGRIDARIAYTRKGAEATLARSFEAANKIYYDTSQRLTEIERANAKALRWNRTVGYAAAGGLGLLCLAVATLTLRQVARILHERRTILGHLEKHRDHLDELVTERTEKLQKLAREHDLILRNAGEGIYGLDRQGRITFVNPAAAALVGRSTEELLGADHHQIVHHHRADGSPYPAAECPIHATLRDGTTHHAVREMFWRRDGTGFHVSLISTPVREGDTVIGAVVTYQDTSARERMEQELRHSEARLRTLLEAVPTGFMIIDAADHRIVDANPAALRLIGAAREQVVGRECHTYVCPAERGRCPITDLGQSVENSERILVTGRGQQVPILKTVVPVTLEGRPHLLESFVDLTERKRIELDLKHAKEAAEDANRAKSEFLANMSHEIRTPMTAILGFSEVLLEHGHRPEAAPERAAAAETIKRNGEYLLQIINDVLDLSKIEADRMDVETRPVPLGPLVSEVASLMGIRAEAKGLPLRVEYAGAVPEQIRTDPTRLRQILINIVGNALKFTEVGSIRLIVGLNAAQDSPRVLFDVVDTGIGIGPDQLGRLFQPFVQADTSTTRHHGGTGLGLALSRRLARLLGGEVTIVKSHPGRGTRVRVSIAAGPLEGVALVSGGAVAARAVPDAGPAASDGPELPLAGCRILLAEDGPDNQRLLKHLLGKAGATTSVVENGRLGPSTSSLWTCRCR